MEWTGKMNQRFISVLVFAFLVAGGASLLLYRLMAARMPNKTAEVTTRVVVAAGNLELGRLIRATDLQTREWTGSRPEGALTKTEEIVGRGVISAIYSGELILANRLAPKGAGAGLASMIPQGMRAVAVRVNEVVGVAGFVVPGMRVDVLISGNPGGQGGSVTRTLLQNIAVLSAGQEFKKDAEGKPISVQVVNLLVSPAEAEMLSLAANQTSIQLVLRNPLDNQVAQTPGTGFAKLFFGQTVAPTPAPPRAKPRPAPAPPPVEKVAVPEPKKLFVMEMIHGTKKVESKFVEVPEVR